MSAALRLSGGARRKSNSRSSVIWRTIYPNGGVYRFMVLLMGEMADPVLANVCARLAARNADLMLVHPESAVETTWNVAWSSDRGVVTDRLRIGRRGIRLSDVSAV